MIYAIYNDVGEQVGGCESSRIEDTEIAVDLVDRINPLCRPGTVRPSVRVAVRPMLGQDFYRYDVMYVDTTDCDDQSDGRIVEQFYAVPAVIGHA